MKQMPQQGLQHTGVEACGKLAWGNSSPREPASLSKAQREATSSITASATAGRYCGLAELLPAQLPSCHLWLLDPPAPMVPVPLASAAVHELRAHPLAQAEGGQDDADARGKEGGKAPWEGQLVQHGVGELAVQLAHQQQPATVC